MNGRPAEAHLIYQRRLKLDLSIREAARRAGISEGSWRRTEGPRRLSRTQHTVARMAQVVGVTPAELETAGRPDAARELAALLPLPEPGAPVTREEFNAMTARLEDLADQLRRASGSPPNGMSDLPHVSGGY